MADKQSVYTIRSKRKDLIDELHQMNEETGIAIGRINEQALDEFFAKRKKEKKG